MTVGERIKERLLELGRDVKWLHQRTGIPVSTLYEIMNGRMKSTPRLPTIASALGLRALWLERKVGPRLMTDADESALVAGSDWPFRFNRERWDKLLPSQQRDIEEVVERMIRAYEAGRGEPDQKSTSVPRQRRAAG